MILGLRSPDHDFIVPEVDSLLAEVLSHFRHSLEAAFEEQVDSAQDVLWVEQTERDRLEVGIVGYLYDTTLQFHACPIGNLQSLAKPVKVRLLEANLDRRRLTHRARRKLEIDLANVDGLHPVSEKLRANTNLPKNACSGDEYAADTLLG